MQETSKYQFYKDSGVEWLGKIPEHWELKRLKFVFEIKKRIAGELGHKVLSITQKGIKIKDVESGDGQLSMDYSKYQLVNKGDFGMNHMDLLTGFVDISKFNGVMSPDYRVFESKESNSDNNYLLRILQLCYTQEIFFAYGQGVSMLGRWRFPSDNFNNFFFPIPSKKEQIAIANFLDKKTALIDKAIQIKEKQIALLQERRQILIQQAVTRGLDSSVPLKDSGVDWIGMIPEHWEVKKLKFCLKGKLKYGANDSGIEYDPDLPRYVRITDFGRNGKLNEEGKLSLTWEKGADYLLKDGDILFARSGATVGKTYQFKLSTSKESYYSYAGYLIKAECNQSLLISDFLYLFTNSELFNSWKEGIFNKATIENIGADKYSQLAVVLPPVKEQKLIISSFREYDNKIQASISLKDREIEKLKEYKSTLINSAVTGKIKVV